MESTSTAATAATTATITSVLELLGTISTWILGQVNSIVGVVMANPLLLIPIGVVMLRTIISVFRSLF